MPCSSPLNRASSTLAAGQVGPLSTVSIYDCTGRTGDTLTGCAVVERTADRAYAAVGTGLPEYFRCSAGGTPGTWRSVGAQP